MNQDITIETKITRDEIADLIAKNYTREEFFNLIVYCLNSQGNQVQAAKELAANLELFAS